MVGENIYLILMELVFVAVGQKSCKKGLLFKFKVVILEWNISVKSIEQ